MTTDEIGRFNKVMRARCSTRPYEELLAAGVPEKTLKGLWVILQGYEKAILQADIAAEQARLAAKQEALAALD